MTIALNRINLQSMLRLDVSKRQPKDYNYKVYDTTRRDGH